MRAVTCYPSLGRGGREFYLKNIATVRPSCFYNYPEVAAAGCDANESCSRPNPGCIIANFNFIGRIKQELANGATYG
jgi:hypothetical protein